MSTPRRGAPRLRMRGWRRPIRCLLVLAAAGTSAWASAQDVTEPQEPVAAEAEVGAECVPLRIATIDILYRELERRLHVVNS